MKIITVYTQLKQLRNKAWKKFRPERESNPWPLRYRCSALTNWAIKPTGSWSIYDYHVFLSHFLHPRVYNELTIDQLPVGLMAQLVRALHRYRRGHGFEFFSGLISQLLKLSIYCDDLHLLKIYFPQYKYMTIMYSYHNYIFVPGINHSDWLRERMWCWLSKS